MNAGHRSDDLGENGIIDHCPNATETPCGAQNSIWFDGVHPGYGEIITGTLAISYNGNCHWKTWQVEVAFCNKLVPQHTFMAYRVGILYYYGIQSRQGPLGGTPIGWSMCMLGRIWCALGNFCARKGMVFKDVF